MHCPFLNLYSLYLASMLGVIVTLRVRKADHDVLTYPFTMICDNMTGTDVHLGRVLSAFYP